MKDYSAIAVRIKFLLNHEGLKEMVNAACIESYQTQIRCQ